MKTSLIGRKEEQLVLQEAFDSSEAELVSVIGRRRVGKTFLVRSTYQDRISFELTGIQNAPRKEQLQNFALQLGRALKSKRLSSQPKNWLEAFYQLIDYLETLPENKKKIVFFDELPWLATHRSGFLRAFGVFWNSWASLNNIVVVICGSAASWMIQKVVNNKGGLHNRITKRIHLTPFTLIETKEFLRSRGVQLDHYQLIQLYCAIGGIPHYLKEVKPGKSATQVIDDVCFSSTGLLKDEFLRLYPALFEDAENHISIIEALASKPTGLLRKEIGKITGLQSGGTISKTLNELEQSGFITSYYNFGKKKKEKIYRLTDEYSLFYLKFIQKQKHEGKDVWQMISQTQSYKIWSGYAFENITLKHINQIKKALGISGIYSSTTTFQSHGNRSTSGIQIDLIIDRNDRLINLCEVKFYNTTFALSKEYAQKLREKAVIFQELTKTSKQIFWTLITTFGLQKNEHSIGLIQNVITLDDFFEP